MAQSILSDVNKLNIIMTYQMCLCRENGGRLNNRLFTYTSSDIRSALHNVNCAAETVNYIVMLMAAIASRKAVSYVSSDVHL